MPEWYAARWVALKISDEPFDETGFSAWIDADAQNKPLFDAMWSLLMGSHMDDALGAYRGRRAAPHLIGRRTVIAPSCDHSPSPSLHRIEDALI